MNSIIVFAIILFSTLIVVIVLFKFLKSDASKTDKGYRLKGAAAGFVVILGFVVAAYSQLIKTIPISQHNEIIEQLKLEKWTISGDIEKEGDPTYLGVTAVYDPPKPVIYIDMNTQKVTLSDVLICRERGFPKIIFRCEGYHSFPLEIDENNDQIDEKSKTIYIKTPILLEKRNGI
jgi:hypothetical protein